MILYIENLRCHQKSFSNNKFSKISRYKISMHKSVTFLYTNNEISKKEIKKVITLAIASKTIEYLEKTIKYLGINITKQVKDLYIAKNKTLMKEVEDTNKWNDILCSWIRRINIVKMSILPKAIYRLNAISINIPMAFS